jgi:hypothetical protein
MNSPTLTSLSPIESRSKKQQFEFDEHNKELQEYISNTTFNDCRGYTIFDEQLCIRILRSYLLVKNGEMFKGKQKI